MAIKDKVVNIVLSAKDRAGSVFKKLFGDLKQTGDESKKADTALGRFGQRLKAMGPSAKVSLNAVKKFGKGVAAFAATVGASVATLSIFSKRQASLADDLTNTSNAIGVSREALQVWQIAGERVGVSGKGVVKTLTSVAERLGKLSATGSGRAAQIFDALNMDIEEFRQLAPDQQLLKLAGAVEKLPKGEQVGVLRALGTDAEKLQPLLENNAAGLRAIAEEAAEAGAIYSEDELDKLNKANDVYNSINIKLKGLVTRIGAELAPAVGEATDAVLGLFGQAQNSDGFIGLFKRLAAGVKEFAESVVNNQGSIVESFNTVINTAKFLGNAVTGVFRGVQTLASGVVTIVAGFFASFLTQIQGVTAALNKVGLVSDETYNNIKAKAEAARATTADLAKQTVEYGKATVQAGADAVNSFDNTTTAADKAATATKKVNEEVKKTTEELLAAANAQEKALGDQLASLEGDVEKAVSRTAQAWTNYYASSGEARKQATIELNKAITEENRLRIEASNLAKDLTKKQIEAEKLLAEVVAEKAAKQQAAIDQAREGLAKLGIDVNKVLTGISTDAQAAIDSMGDFAAQLKEAGLEGEQAGKAIEAGIANALKSINNRSELDALKAKIESLGESGELGAEAVKTALESISEKAEETAREISESLSQAIGSAETMEALDALKAKIESLKESGEIGAKGANTALESVRKKLLQLELAKIRDNLGLDDVPEAAEKAAEGVKKVKDETEELKKSASGTRDAFREALGGAFSGTISQATMAVAKLSLATRNLFERRAGLKEWAGDTESYSEALRVAEQDARKFGDALRSPMRSARGVASAMNEISLASATARVEYYSQAVAMENLTEKINSGELSMRQLDMAANSVDSKFNLLDKQTLSGLQSAIDQARSKIESLESSAESTLNSLSQRLAEIQGDTERAQQLQYEAEKKRLIELQKQAEQQGADNAAADYGKALDQLQKINTIEQKNRREADNEREKEAAALQAQQEQAERERQTFERQRNQTVTSTQPTIESIKTVNVNLGGQAFQVLASDEDAFLNALEKARSTAL